MGRLLIGIPRTERAAKILGDEMEDILSAYGGAALPLPRDLCRDLVVEGVARGPGALEEIALRHLPPSLARVWMGFLEKIPRLAVKIPEAEVVCYSEPQDLGEVYRAGYRLASLLIRARIKLDGRIDPRPWVELFRGREPREIPQAVRKPLAVVAEGYPSFSRLARALSWERIRTLQKLVPTPLEILEMVASHEISEDVAWEAVRFAVRYLGDYVVGSRDYSEAYEKLLADKEYQEFLQSLPAGPLQEPLKTLQSPGDVGAEA